MAKVLVVDDEENIRKTLREILEDEAHQVVLAGDGEAALKLFRDEEPDIVLLDIQLPKKDGLAVLEAMKACKTDAEVIMISGHGTIESAVRAVKTGRLSLSPQAPVPDRGEAERAPRRAGQGAAR